MAEIFNTFTYGPRNWGKNNAIRLAVAIIALLLLLWLFPFGQIGPGERGVHMRFTAVTGKIFGEGLYFVIPLIEKVQKVDIQVQKEEMKADAASKDLQTVHIVVAMNYHIDPNRVARIFQEVGLDYKVAHHRSRNAGGGKGFDGQIHCRRTDHQAGGRTLGHQDSTQDQASGNGNYC